MCLCIFILSMNFANEKFIYFLEWGCQVAGNLNEMSYLIVSPHEAGGQKSQKNKIATELYTWDSQRSWRWSRRGMGHFLCITSLRATSFPLSLHKPAVLNLWCWTWQLSCCFPLYLCAQTCQSELLLWCNVNDLDTPERRASAYQVVAVIIAQRTKTHTQTHTALCHQTVGD